MDNDLYLIYVNNLGVDFLGNNQLEFIFSKNEDRKKIDGEHWSKIPSSGWPEPPNEEFIDKVGLLETQVDFEFAQDSTCYCLWDAIDGIVALAYEDIREFTEYPESRIIFHFGESQKSVEAKLYERDLILKYKK